MNDYIKITCCSQGTTDLLATCKVKVPRNIQTKKKTVLKAFLIQCNSTVELVNFICLTLFRLQTLSYLSLKSIFANL